LQTNLTDKLGDKLGKLGKTKISQRQKSANNKNQPKTEISQRQKSAKDRKRQK
jgi:hypothetical protein